MSKKTEKGGDFDKASKHLGAHQNTPDEMNYISRINSPKVSQDLDALQLTRQQLMFCVGMSDNVKSATQCAKDAGFAESSAHVAASRLVKMDKIKKAISIFANEQILALGSDKRLLREYILIIIKDNFKSNPAIALTGLKQLAELDGHVTKHGVSGAGGNIVINISGLAIEEESGLIIEHQCVEAG